MKFLKSMEFIVTKPYFCLFSVLVFVTPLIVVSNTNELYEFPKTFFLYFFGILLIGIFLTELVLQPFKLKVPSLLISGWILTNIVSTFFSSHTYTSLWGYYTRFNDGLVSNLIFFGIYFIAINKLTRKDFENLLKIAGLTVLPIGIAGFSEHFGIGINPVLRAYSTFGQPNWLAQYLAMLLPLTVFFSLKDRFSIWLAIYSIGFSCLWFTYSVSGILGYLVSLVIITIVMVRQKLLITTNSKKILLTILLSLIIAIFNMGLFAAKINDALNDVSKYFSLIQKVYAAVSVSTGNQVSDPGFIRFGLWQGTVNLILSSPKNFVIGTGPETFAYTFQPFRLRSLNYSSEWDFVFNKPHNYYLETWAEVGFIGILFYLTLLLKLIKELPVYLLPTTFAFIFTNFFGWPVVATASLFWILLAFSETK